MSVLSIRDLSVDIGKRRVLNGVALDLEAGESHALVGESAPASR